MTQGTQGSQVRPQETDKLSRDAELLPQTPEEATWDQEGESGQQARWTTKSYPASWQHSELGH